MSEYHPTVWRTCRVLANNTRLECLRLILTQPRLTVTEVAEQTEISIPKASQSLRLLQARGLIAASREGRFVRYQTLADPLVPSAKPILDAMRTAMITHGLPNRPLATTLTTFTHPRRLRILSVLHRRQRVSSEELAAATYISQRALMRHLDKLTRRQVVDEHDGFWSLSPSTNDLHNAILRIVCE